MQLIYQRGGDVANSKFDYSLLEPIEENNGSNIVQATPGFDQALLTPMEKEEKEEQFLPPKEEGIGTWLPRDIMIGLLNQRQNLVNQPYEFAKSLEDLGKGINTNFDKQFGLEKLLKGQNVNIPELNTSSYLPHEQNDFAKLMGQEGEPTTGSWLIQKGVEHAPELLGLAQLARGIPITARGIINRMSRHKQEALGNARTQYGDLFNEAAQEGITHAIPPVGILRNRDLITRNSSAKHHRLYNQYLENPTLENAHWAQSELGSLERHLEKIENKQGLTPIQHQTLRAANQARQQIRASMFNHENLGRNPFLSDRYQHLSNQYRENVIPYTRLEELSETEANRLRPKTAVKELLKDDQFMIELARRYPGIFLHTPAAKSLGRKALGVGAVIGGYEGVKKLLR